MVAIKQISNNNSENLSTDSSSTLDKEVTGKIMEDKSLDSTQATEASAKSVEPKAKTKAKPKAKAKKGRGRPKGSKNKKK